MLKGKMITGSEAIIRRLEISEASFMFLIQMKKLPAKLNQDCQMGNIRGGPPSVRGFQGRASGQAG